MQLELVLNSPEVRENHKRSRGRIITLIRLSFHKYRITLALQSTMLAIANAFSCCSGYSITSLGSDY